MAVASAAVALAGPTELRLRRAGWEGGKMRQARRAGGQLGQLSHVDRRACKEPAAMNDKGTP